MRVLSLACAALLVGVCALAGAGANPQEALEGCQAHADAWKIKSVLRLHDKIEQGLARPAADAAMARLESDYGRKLAFCAAASSI